MVKKILEALLKKEKAVAMLVSFLLGAGSSALGLNVDAVKHEICSGAEPTQE